MKYAGLLLAVFLCFVAANGFCKGKQEAQTPIASDTDNSARFEDDLRRERARAEMLQRQVDQMGAVRPQAVIAPVPITREILAQVNEHKQDLNKLSYYLSMNIVLTVNKNETTVSLNDEGRIRYTERNTPKPIKISAKTAGKKELNVAQDFLGNDRQIFEIAFPDETNADKQYYLKFARNDKNNCFDLASVEYEGTIYGFTLDGLKPHLCVYYEYAYDDASRIEVQGMASGTSNVRRTTPIEVIPEVSTSVETASPSETVVAETDGDTEQVALEQPVLEQSVQDQIDQSVQIADSSETVSPNGDVSEPVVITTSEPRIDRNLSAIGDMPVMGAGTLRIDPIVDFIWSKNREAKLSDIKEIIRIYIDESRQEGVNSDLAIAQMCHATDYLKSVRFYNYAGLSSDDIATVRFSNARDGVIAHIQHLKGYASSEKPREPIVDPRFDLLGERGLANTAKTFDELLAKWAPRYDYGNDIKDKLKLLYQVSDSQI